VTCDIVTPVHTVSAVGDTIASASDVVKATGVTMAAIGREGVGMKINIVTRIHRHTHVHIHADTHTCTVDGDVVAVELDGAPQLAAEEGHDGSE